MSESVSHQALLEQLQACSSQDERERLLMRFTLERLPEHLRAVVQAAAVPRFFDRAFLNALLDQPLNEAQFAELTSLSYIEPYPGEGRFNVHERSRKLLQEKLWQEDEALYREISRRAFVYCAKQNQDDRTWRIETVYHQLIAEPDKGAIALNNTCAVWINPPYFAYDKAESLLRAVWEHVELKRLSENAAHYFLLWQARMDISSFRYRQAKAILEQLPLSAIKKNNPYLSANCLQVLGDAHNLLSELPVARQRYEEAIILCQNIDDRIGESKCLFCLGQTHLQLLELPEARLRYKKAMLLCRNIGDRLGEANCLKALGDVHLRLSELPAARQHYDKALKLFQGIGARLGEFGCLKALGKVHLCLSELPEAEKRFEEALKGYRDISEAEGEADSLRMFGWLEVRTGNFAAAHQYFEQASAQFERAQCPGGIAECWEGFAKLHQAQQQFPQTEECWQKAADMYHQLAMPLRAEHCLEQLRRMKEQISAARERNESSTSNG